MRLITVINMLLFAMVLFLVADLIKPATITANIIYNLDASEPKCYFSNLHALNEIPLNRCCYEIQKQIACKPFGEKESDLKCYCSETSEKYYIINQKTLNYCRKEGYDVKVG